MSKKYSKKDVLAFMKENPIMSLSVNGATYPISSILLFAIDDDFTMYFGTHEPSFKSKALQDNPHMSFSCWEHERMLVQGSGDVTQIEGELVSPVLEKIAASAVRVKDFWPPVLRIDQGDYIIFSAKITWMQVLDLSSSEISAKSLPIQEIDL